MKDEIMLGTDCIDRLRVDHAPLSTFLKMDLVRVIEDDAKGGNPYIRLVVIIIDRQIITTFHADANQMKSEIKLFDRGNVFNHFFKTAKLDIKSKKFKELGFADEDTKNERDTKLVTLTNKFPLKEDIFISLADADGIIQNWYDAFIGYRRTKLIEFPSEQSLECLAKLLKKYGYLDA
ncbi:MAG: hypothetical protein PHW18_05975 [Sulfuricurvum sp.]|uniref:hypothetical protein n=1 Tax=Sulfuricurvum sp. TaxID=2025608 RepID=UPI0026086FD1|nr:hypothetical protein [Sulfuricurvum sp.]MDD2829105.1 hypothetical protein [Sulfuricurvum sp.]MDD4948853.1 hypothetical protein [Sulfuricurvum sp.]